MLGIFKPIANPTAHHRKMLCYMVGIPTSGFLDNLGKNAGQG
jgi:hypothetical protein